MNITVNDDLKAYIDPLTTDEYSALERSLLTEGCRDALVLWGDVLVDGHNRYAICQAHGLTFQTVQSTLFRSLDDVHLWMIDQHLGRRSVSDFQRGVLALRKREILGEQGARTQAPQPPDASAATASTTDSALPWEDAVTAGPSNAPAAQTLSNRDDLAKAARLSNSQMVLIEKIHKQAAPELVAAVKSGAISINAAAAVSSLSTEEQVAAASAGTDELKQAAKRVRDAKRKPSKPKEEASDTDDLPTADAAATADEVRVLQKRVRVLEAENDGLRKQVLTLLARQAP
jgi:hypothetical protein